MKLQRPKFRLRYLTPLVCLVAGLACSDEAAVDDGDDGDSTDGMGGDSGMMAGEDCSEPGETDVSGTVEVFSWWDEGGEADALQAMLDVHLARAPDAKWTNSATDIEQDFEVALLDRMQDGNPPDVFQANAGADLMKWVLFNDTDDSSTKVEGLNNLADEECWWDKFDPDILDAVSFDGTLYSLPLNVHRINSMFYRKDLFEKHGLTPPTTLEELHTLCDTIKNDADIQAEGPEGTVACMGLGNQWEWTFALMAFEMIMPAVAGPDYYESFWQGNESPTDQQVTDTLDEALFLYCGGTDTSNCPESGYFNADVDTVDWTTAAGQMASGAALMAPMGDWAKGFFESEGLVPEEDFGVIPFPGTEGTFVFTSDSFAMPRGLEKVDRDRAIELLRTFGSKEGQIAFNEKKGSIPPRTDIDPTEFDAQIQGVIEDFENSAKPLALSGLTSQMGERGAELKSSLQGGSTEIIANYLEANYSSLQE